MAQKKKRGGLHLSRFYTCEGDEPLDSVRWAQRDAVITDSDGKVVFEQDGVSVPARWSETALRIVASKYFHGQLNTPERETSIGALVARVANTITGWGVEDGCFETEADGATFRAELTHLLLHQKAAFNSPVWFNVGVHGMPQCSACFIQSVKDNMSSIMKLARSEAMLFKHGSGTGSNLSTLRSSREGLSGGGIASGPVSFMHGFDAFAGVIKSGGTTRRAAKMVILNADHPDIREFIGSKVLGERVAHGLVAAGFDADFTASTGAYGLAPFQNANHSVRVTDEFMHAVEEGGTWTTCLVTTGEPAETLKARELLKQIAHAAWTCGDPGLQFDTVINAWHTCPESGRINASNPCGEYMFLDDSACNLASLNLLRFYDEERFPETDGFDVEGFIHAARVVITAMEILVGHSSYPTETITLNSHRFRPLGIGYANLGALLMARGLPYDSDEGRAYAAAITALMSGAGYLQSAHLAEVHGPFEGLEKNRVSMLTVLQKHRAAINDISGAPDWAVQGAKVVWEEALKIGKESGFRNAQIAVLAPTGTIGFMMDCDTTGVEPELALMKTKRLVGGGTLQIVNQTVPRALQHLGYDGETIGCILAHIKEHGGIEGAPGLADEHLAVFDCALRPPDGQRFIQPSGHLAMLAAVQPFLSGAISKTVNVPEETTVDEIAELFVEAWRLGLKAVTIYRDGCKQSQPLSAGVKTTNGQEWVGRRRLPDTRGAITHKFSVVEHQGYVTVGLYPDGTPGEIFLVMAKEGSTISGLMDAFATTVSIALQYGVPLKTLVEKFSHMRFEPAGFTQNQKIPIAKSLVDYIFRWLASEFLDENERRQFGIIESGEGYPIQPANSKVDVPQAEHQQDAPACHVCGLIMVRNGSCYKCPNCGTTSGCS